MIIGAAKSIGIRLERLIIIPFSLNVPETWHEYVPQTCVHFVTILSDWEKAKVERIMAAGYQVETRQVTRDISASEDINTTENISASDIRARIALDEPIDHLVPRSTQEVLGSLMDPALKGNIS